MNFSRKMDFSFVTVFERIQILNFGPKLESIMPKVFRKIEDEKLLKSKRNISTLILLFELCKLVSFYKT